MEKLIRQSQGVAVFEFHDALDTNQSNYVRDKQVLPDQGYLNVLWLGIIPDCWFFPVNEITRSGGGHVALIL